MVVAVEQGDILVLAVTVAQQIVPHLTIMVVMALAVAVAVGQVVI
jgi:hypothetical protein